MLLALRINVLAKGHSGISLENVEKLIKAFNGECSQITYSNNQQINFYLGNIHNAKIQHTNI